MCGDVLKVLMKDMLGEKIGNFLWLFFHVQEQKETQNFFLRNMRHMPE